MKAVDLSPTTASVRQPAPSWTTEVGLVTGVWGVGVLAAAVFPLQEPHVVRAALFIHLMSMAVGFGAVVMIDVYGLQWLLGRRTLAELADLARVAHGVIVFGTGGLLASGVALHPDLTSGLTRFKLVLVLTLMLNGAGAQRWLRHLKTGVPAETRGAAIPWRVFQRGLLAAIVSQSTWWGSIAIGFITNAKRHG